MPVCCFSKLVLVVAAGGLAVGGSVVGLLDGSGSGLGRMGRMIIGGGGGGGGATVSKMSDRVNCSPDGLVGSDMQVVMIQDAFVAKILYGRIQGLG